MRAFNPFSAFPALLVCIGLILGPPPSKCEANPAAVAAGVAGVTIKLTIKYSPRLGQIVVKTRNKVVAVFKKKKPKKRSNQSQNKKKGERDKDSEESDESDGNPPSNPSFGSWILEPIGELLAEQVIAELFEEQAEAFQCTIETPEGDCLTFSLEGAKTVTVHCNGGNTVIYRCCDDESRSLRFVIHEDTEYYLEIEPKIAKDKDRGIKFKSLSGDREWMYEGQVLNNAPHGVGILKRSVGEESVSIGSFFSGLRHGSFLTYKTRDLDIIDAKIENFYLGLPTGLSINASIDHFESGLESFLFMGQTQNGNPEGFGTAFFADDEGIPKLDERFFVGYFGMNARRGTEVGEAQLHDRVRYSRSFNEYDSTIRLVGQTGDQLPQFPFPKVRVSSDEMRLMLERLQKRMGSDAEISHVSNVASHGNGRLIDCVVEYDHEGDRLSREWRFHFAAPGELLREGELPLLNRL